MGSANHDRILAAAIDWAGAPMAIATVVETWKSAPCPVGTHMLVHADGRFVGSVSGGCVEGDVLERAQLVLAGAPPVLRRYGVADDAAWDVGLPCGGDIQVLVQPVSADGFPAHLFGDINKARSAGAALSVATDLESGRSALVDDDAAAGFVNIYHPPRRLLIVGAVEIASALAAIATSQGVDVTLCDPRGRFLTAERFPGVRLEDRWPDAAVKAFAPDSRSAIVTLSHDPKIDDPALAAALASPAAYVAALGSVRSHQARLARLSAAGVSAEQCARIEGPAGVAINAISAPEIALSIAGGMIRAFNQGLR
ncbi:MAG: XshC-Cox1-family protein [Sphingomonadales bacterium 35-56-22]|jgi:xanthine dehydrogenase accessory factor|nr:MAG: XshC-Cox1-family protein [Sphingomonadales bacterium 35-56-22]OYY98939.1 MAG: XshC-Cox1-family protein [Sphingomonadales bacterium 28-56-43]OYZ60409.1 MAG: XshC-Cox1-family protein [Sphingomonadales bacterium 24-56-14]OZA83292.1 MAG: XshC-Cox1-family protein [Sphingomonadales bacterium 39-57-19]